MHMPSSNSTGDFTPPPAGTHIAVCYRVIDLGTQLVDWQGQQKRQHKILLSWELPDERMEDGHPFTIHQRYTFSSHEKSRLRQDLESWRGAAFTEKDLGPGGFDIKNVIGVPCLLTVIHEAKNGKTYANIRAISKLPKGTKAPNAENASAYLSLDNFDVATFNGLSDGLRSAIMKSPEYQAAQHKSGVSDAPSAKHEDPDDAIPF